MYGMTSGDMPNQKKNKPRKGNSVYGGACY